MNQKERIEHIKKSYQASFYPKKCDISGDEDNEFTMKFNKYQIGYHGIEILKEKCDEMNTEDKFVIEHQESIFCFYIEETECDLCFETRDCLGLTKPNSGGSDLFICTECITACRKLYSRHLDSIIHSGFCFKVISLPETVVFTDFVLDGSSKDDNILVFGNKDIATSLSNIEEVSEGLKNPENCSFITDCDNEECTICDKSIDDGIIFYNFELCNKCHSSLSHSLESYVKENKNEIVSKLI